MEAQLILATLLESQAWRVTGRNRQPGTAGATAQRTRFQTPGFGRTPYIPGDTPAAGRTGGLPAYIAALATVACLSQQESRA